MAKDWRIEIKANSDCTDKASAMVQILHALESSDLRDRKKYFSMSRSKTLLLKNILRNVLIENIEKVKESASDVNIGNQEVIDCIEDIFD